MTLDLKNPCGIYQRINNELERIIGLLNSQSKDEILNQENSNAHKLLSKYQKKLQKQLAKLEENAEWKTFTIAFYGETGAGKSTLIETLRILLQEPSKCANQQAFRETQKRYALSENKLQHLQQAMQNEFQISELEQVLDVRLATQYAQPHSEHLNITEQTSACLAELPQKIGGKLQQRQEIEKHLKNLLGELDKLADGEIIGDGRADFTRNTQRYDFTLDGQSFALLDVPGIEGNEDLIRSQIGNAVQTAHAVFYVTNQAAPPQTGDEESKGTLEKIKEHLGTQTEVWAIFNKKITNPKYALGNRPLISDDEKSSLAGLDEKMREQLGTNYRGTFALTALPAFLASTNNFSPGSQNAKRRSKLLEDFSAKDLLEKSRMREFIQLLDRQLLSNSKAKITRANINKAKEALDQTTEKLCTLQGTFTDLERKLDQSGKSAQSQLNSSFNALKQRLESCGENLINNFASAVRNKTYEIIESRISNDHFKDALRAQFQEKQEKLSKQLPSAMGAEIEKFQKDAEEIFKRFEEQARDLAETYSKLSKTKVHEPLDLDIKLDNGLKINSLLGLLAGGALLWLTPAGWVVIAISVVTIAAGAYKAVRCFFSSDYKKAQQRKATDENLHNATKKLRHSLREALNKALPEMQQKISQLEQAIEAPAKQASVQAKILNRSVNQLKAISHQIGNAGNL